MSEERKRYEGEEIQKGLEDFIDRELNLGIPVEEDRDLKKTSGESVPDLDLIGFDNTIHNVTMSEVLPENEFFVEEEGKTKKSDNRHQEYVRYENRSRDCRRRTQGNDDEERRPNSGRTRYEKNGKKIRKDEVKQQGRDNKNLTKKEKNMKSGKNAKNKKKNKRKGFFVFFAILFILVFGGLYMMVGSVYSKMTYEEAEGMSKEPYKENGVINVLLIGNDSRLGGDDGRSDAMILVSISDKTKTVTMTSFLRDMYVDIPGHDGNRLNAAYAYGGPKLLMETIEANFDIPVHRYALVNFEAFANLVDAVGGIDLDVTNDEVQLINGYLMEYNELRGENLDYDWLDSSASGMIHLNGAQALAYTRNRYIGTDFGRTERQRKVLSEVFKKAPMAMVTNGNGVIDGLFPNLTTNLKQSECYSISLNAWKLAGYEMVQQCVPVEGTYKNATIRSMAVLQVDFDANKRFLKETLYGE